MYIQFSLFTVVEDKPKCQRLLSELAKYLLDPFVQVSGWNYTSSPVVAFKRNNFLSSNRWLVRISFRCRGSWVQRPTYPVSVSANASFSQHYYHIYSIWGDKYSWLVVMGNFSWTQIRATLNWIRMLSQRSHRAKCHQKPWDEHGREVSCQSHNTPEETIKPYHSPAV